MPFSDITGLTSSNTFSDLFLKNNEMITRLNELDIGYIIAGTGVTLSSIGSTGGVTLSVDLSSLNTDLSIKYCRYYYWIIAVRSYIRWDCWFCSYIRRHLWMDFL